MADHTEISWTDATWSPITGCSIKSTGCQNCYAQRLAGTRLKHHPSRAGLTREVNGKHVWTGEVRFNEQWLDQPLRWGKPKDIFVVAHGDLFHENVPDGWIVRVLDIMARCPHHRFQILTKRPERAGRFFAAWADLSGEDFGNAKLVRGPKATRDAHPSGRGQLFAAMLDAIGKPPPGAAFPTFDWAGGMIGWPDGFSNIWIGTSIERQPEADQRREHLAAIAAAGWNTWVSYEPALGPVDWSGWEFIRWMVSGGESGPGARPSHPDWHRRTRDWCAANSVPYHFKQWGSWAPSSFGRVAFVCGSGTTPDVAWPDGTISWGSAEDHGGPGTMLSSVGKKAAGALLDGVEHRAMPTERKLYK